jgi:ribosomal protein L34E
MASIKVFDPVSVPLTVLEELQQLRAQIERLHQENEHLRRENERLRRELEAVCADLDQARRQSQRQAAPFSKGPPKPRPKRPGRQAGTAHGRHGHRLPPDPTVIEEVREAPLPSACPKCGGPLRETGVAAQSQTDIPRRPLIRRFHVHIGRCCDCGRRVQGRTPCRPPTLWAPPRPRAAPRPRPWWSC